MKFQVFGNILERLDKNCIPSGNIGSVEAEFIFKGEEWENVEKSVIFSTKNNRENVLLIDNKCTIPEFCTCAESCFVTLEGVADEKRLVTNMVKIWTRGNYFSNHECHVDPVQYAYEQVLRRLLDIENKSFDIDGLNREIEEVKQKVGQAVANTIDKPFQTAYWKDSATNKIYLVQVKNGELTVTEQGASNSDTPQDPTLDGLLTDRLLIWHDEFDTFDATKWSYEIGGRYRASGAELQYYTDDSKNVYIEDSVLHLKAIRETYQGKDSTPYDWTSGSVTSNNKFEFGYGRIEAKLKMQRETGSFPAFWLMGANYNYKYNSQEDNDKGTSNGYPWSNCGEIDIMELFGNKTYITTSLHHKESIGAEDVNTKVGDTTVDVTEWHTYALERTENKLEIYVDNVLSNTITLTEPIMQTIFKKPMFILLNNAIGSVAGTPSNEKTQMDFQIDWVRFYAPKAITQSTKATSISLDKSELSLTNGENELLEVTFNPSWVDDMTLAWNSSNTSVCTAFGGYVKSVGVGETTVTVEDRYGNSKSCKVTVVESTSDTPVKKEHTIQFSVSSQMLSQYEKIDGTTGENGTTTTNTVYGTKDFTDVSEWDRKIKGTSSNVKLGGFYLYEYDEDKNFLCRTCMWSNTGTYSEQYTMKDNTSYLKFMVTGMTTETFSLTYKK